MSVRSSAWASVWNDSLAAAIDSQHACELLWKLQSIFTQSSQFVDSVSLPPVLAQQQSTTHVAMEPVLGAAATSSAVLGDAAKASVELQPHQAPPAPNKDKTVNKLRAELGFSDGATVLVLGAFMRGAEAKLWSEVMGGSTARPGQATLTSASPFRSDIGLDKIIVDGEQLFIKEAPDQRLTLNFIGRVTRVPTLTSLPLCVVWGEQLYVEGVSHKSSSPMQIDSYVPAWSVPLAHAKVKKDKPQYKLKMEESELPYDFAYSVGMKKRKISTSLTVYRLVLADSTGGTVFAGEGRAQIVRQVEGDKFPIKETLPKPRSTPSASGGLDKTLGPPVDKADAKFGHMWR